MKIRSGSRCKFPNQKITMSMSSLSATDCLRADPGGLIYKTQILIFSWEDGVFCQYTLQFWLSVKSVGHKIALAESVLAWPWQERVRDWPWPGPACPAHTGPLTLSLRTQTGYRIIHIRASGLAKHNISAQIQCLQIFFLTLTIEPFSIALVAMITRYTRTFWLSLITVSSNSLT